MKNKINIEAIEWKEGNVKNFFGKELLAQENGTLKLVKVAPSALYPEHIHPDKAEYAYVLKGHPNFLIGEEEFAAKPDEFYIFPSKVKHSISNKSGKDCILLVGSIQNENE